jgi:hypothetical protein
MPKTPTPKKASPKKSNGAAPRKLTQDAAAQDPTSPEALRALAAAYADAPDMPIEVAVQELGALARLAKKAQTRLTAVGLGPEVTARVARFAKRLAACEDAWQDARAGVKLTAKERTLLEEAEALDNKLVAGGRWACRKDAEAQKELTAIAEGSGLRDTVNDLRDGASFWGRHADRRGDSDVTAADLRRAVELADALEPAAQKEEADLDAAAALELRNRCFWAADELAKDVREGGRYAFSKQPKVAAKFTSRYRAAANRRSRQKAKSKAAAAQPKTNGATPA